LMASSSVWFILIANLFRLRGSDLSGSNCENL
jgi:hypothetical protein